MSHTHMLRGLTTVRFHTSDLAAAKQWYSEFLGTEPYYERPGYVEFRLGDYQHELGLLDSNYLQELNRTKELAATSTSPVVYWQTDDVLATFERLLSMNATPYEPIRDFGTGFVAASVVDPFGNILGIMYNPQYMKILNPVRNE